MRRIESETLMLTLYPEIEPFHSEHLLMEKLPDGRHHEIYIEQCGNPNGIPVLFLHGGPGSGCRPMHRCFFDPQRYHIVLFDQRGCGRSLPKGELEHNNADYLVADIEAIRQHLNIKQWLLFGGSWGSTLALLYARQYPESVSAMILRGIFLGRQQDIDWVYAQGGASRIFPEAWQSLVERLPVAEQAQPLKAYQQMLQQDDVALTEQAASNLQHWEATIVMMRAHEYQADPEATVSPLAHSLIQLHFALNECFISDRPILSNLDAVQQIPTRLIHGRYDMVCPVEQALLLKQQLPGAELEIVPLAGHAAGEPALIDALIRATNDMADRLS